jgi:flagella basal body P-ring formation protein FlgA
MFLPATSALGLDITFKPAVEVDADSIYLSDIVEMSDKSQLSNALSTQVVCPSPLPGQTTHLDARAVISQVEKRNGYIAEISWQGSATVLVTRLSITIGPEKISSIIGEFIEQKRPLLPRAEIRFIPESFPIPFHLPTGTLSYDVIPSSPAVIGSSRFSIIFKVDGRVRKNISITGHTEALAPVVVAKTNLKYGSPVTADAVAIATRDLSDVDAYASQIDEVVGSIVKRAIKSGAVIDTTAIEEPPVIQRGEPVRIVINYKGLVVTATGIAKADGKKDEIIRVRNANSNKLIYCRVQAPGLVEVTL